MLATDRDITPSHLVSPAIPYCDSANPSPRSILQASPTSASDMHRRYFSVNMDRLLKTCHYIRIRRS